MWTTTGHGRRSACGCNRLRSSVGFMREHELEATVTGRRAQPRTVFEELIRKQDRTYEEVARDFERAAQQLGERGLSISTRHLRRLASGERTGTTPATRRVLQVMFNRRMDELLQPWASGGFGEGKLPSPQPPLGATSPEILKAAAQRAHGFALLAQTSMTSELMEQLYDDVGQLARIYSHRPLPEILGLLATTQDNLFRLLEARQIPARARQLYFLAGVMSGLLARASNDLGDPYAALTQARTGFLCADRADHDGLRAMIRAWQTVITFWADRPHDAVGYAQSGMQFASAARNTTLVWLASLEARAWARLGNAAKACELVGHAERLRDQVQPDELDDLGGLCTCDRSRQLYVAADALTWLPEQVGLCHRYAEEAVVAYQDCTAPDWSFAFQAGSHTALAIARIRMGELDGAAEAMASVFELAAPQQINPVMQSVWRVHAALSSSPLVGGHPELAEKIKVFAGTHHAHNVGAELPGTTRHDSPYSDAGGNTDNTNWPNLLVRGQSALAGTPPDLRSPKDR